LASGESGFTLVGAAIGYLTSEYIYRKHHNPDLQGGAWDIPAIRPDLPSHWQSKFMGSPCVPPDSWIYPALQRLAALGYISSGIAGMCPWTRLRATGWDVRARGCRRGTRIGSAPAINYNSNSGM